MKLPYAFRLLILLGLLAAAFGPVPAVGATGEQAVGEAAISDCNASRTGGSTGSGAAAGAGGAAAGATGAGSAAGAQGTPSRNIPTPVPGPVLTVKAYKSAGAAGAAGSASRTSSSTSGVAALSWTDASRYTIQEYQVWYGLGGARPILNTGCRVSARTFQVTIGGLRSGYTYVFQVVAIGGRAAPNRYSRMVTVKIP